MLHTSPLMNCLRVLAILFISHLAVNKVSAVDLTPTVRQDSASVKKGVYTYKIISSANQTFGYNVFADGKLIIHQLSIPGINGMNGFKSKADAEKVAKLVKKKLESGNALPSVSHDELKELGIVEQETK